MSWIRVKGSSQIHSLRYNADEGTMDAKFVCFSCKGDDEKSKDCAPCRSQGWSSHYLYEEVPVERYDKVRSADSVGSSFNEHIKRGGFKFKRIAP